MDEPLSLGPKHKLPMSPNTNLIPSEVLLNKIFPNFKDFNDDEMTATARDRQFVAYYGWKPYLHSLSLARWLHRISVPTHLIWGAGDGFTTPEYGKKLSKLIPDAILDILPNAGHYPQLEQLEKTIETILAGPCGNRQIGRVA